MNVIGLAGNPFGEMWKSVFGAAGFEVLALNRASARAARPGDLVVIQWPENGTFDESWPRHVRRVTRFARTLRGLRRADVPIMYVAHNATPHSRKHHLLLRWTYAILVRRATGMIVLSRGSRPAVVQALPVLARLPWFEVRHPAYETVLPIAFDSDQRRDFRASLGVADHAKLILHFGTMHAYKGVPTLLDAFHGARSEDAHLLLAGAIADDVVRDDLARAESADGRIIVRSGHADAADLERMIRSADLVVLPYERVLTSGSAVLALSYGARVLVPDSPAFAELQADTGGRHVTRYRGSLTSEVLADALATPADDARPDLGSRSIAACAAALAEAIQLMCGPAPRPVPQPAVVVFAANEFRRRIPLGDWHLVRAFARIGTQSVLVDPPESLSRTLYRAVRQHRRLVEWNGADGVTVVRPVRMGSERIEQWLLRLTLARVVSTPFISVATLPRHARWTSVGAKILVYWQKDRQWSDGSLDDAARAALLADHRRLLERADVVTGVSEAIIEDNRAAGVAATLVSNGVEIERWSTRRSAPQDLAAIPHPRAVFVGPWTWRIDRGLVDRLLTTVEGLHVVVVGPAQPVDLPNLHFVGSRSYDQVPAYLQACDVGIVPYERTAFNAASAPLKILEFAACGLPVVATGVAETVASPLVTYCGTDEEFIAAVVRAVSVQVGAQASLTELRPHSWLARAQTLLDLVEEHPPRLGRRKDASEPGAH